MSKERRQFSAEYKREALSLVVNQQLSVAEAARRLGISANLLYRWKSQLVADGEQAFPSSGQFAAQDVELARLRRENEQFRLRADVFTLGRGDGGFARLLAMPRPEKQR